jgi:G3E family GTPase
MADRVVITKADRVNAEALGLIEGRVRAINPGAAIARSAPELALPDGLLEAGLYRGAPAAADATGWLRSGAYRRAGGEARHATDIASFVWVAEEPFEPASLELALRAVVGAAGATLLRLKGLAQVRGEAGPRAVHAVGHTLYPSARLARWPDADRSSRLAFIGRGLEEDRIASILDSFRSR